MGLQSASDAYDTIYFCSDKHGIFNTYYHIHAAVFEPLMERFMEMDLAKLRVLGIGGMLLLTADFLYNAARTYKNREMKPMWRIYVKGEKAHQFHR